MLLLAAAGQAMARIAIFRPGLTALMIAVLAHDIHGLSRLMLGAPTRPRLTLQSEGDPLLTAWMLALPVPDIHGLSRLMLGTPTRLLTFRSEAGTLRTALMLAALVRDIDGLSRLMLATPATLCLALQTEDGMLQTARMQAEVRHG